MGTFLHAAIHAFVSRERVHLGGMSCQLHAALVFGN